MFDKTQYTYNTITSSQLTTKAASTGIMLMTQMSQCRQVEFMESLDNRFSDISFASSFGLNIISQLAMVNKSQIYYSFQQMASTYNSNAAGSVKWQTIGLLFMELLTKSIGYFSPGRTAQARTY